MMRGDYHRIREGRGRDVLTILLTEGAASCCSPKAKLEDDDFSG